MGQVLHGSARVNEDLLGQAFEHLIKKFADDSGHTAAEFYTNRTVVHLMTLLLEPQEGESVYDPTCGSGGMLLSAREGRISSLFDELRAKPTPEPPEAPEPDSDDES
jgi:hypothetical protein